MYQQLNIAPRYRYERKFTAHNTERAFPLAHIQRHPALFRPIFHSRKVNNIYLDTDALQFYNNNKKGIAQRKKIRIRWYGATFGHIQKPKLEYKLKNSLVGDKWTFDLVDFELTRGFSHEQLRTIFEQSNLSAPIMNDLHLVKPTLLNTYERSYFLSADQHFRLTFDEALCYYRATQINNSFLQKQEDRRDFILELKYGLEHDTLANQIAQHIPYRLNKSSKYVNGIDYTHFNSLR